MPVAIAGMHRSGTSMVAKILNLCGLYLGNAEDLIPPADDNPQGFWENIKFHKLNNEILSSFNGAWDTPPALEVGWESSPRLAVATQNANHVIKEISQRPMWGWKDPRNSLTLPFWKRLIPNLKVIICVRNPFEVYRSLERRGYASSIFSYNLWLTYNQQLLTSTEPRERIFTHYDTFFRDPQSELRRLLDFLELEASNDVINTACQTTSTSLRRNRGSLNDLYVTNPSDQLLDLYRDLCLQSGRVYGHFLSPEENTFLQNIAPAEESEITALKNDPLKIWQYLKGVNEEKSRLQKEIARLQAEKAREATEFREKIAMLQHDFDQILTSRSWRLIQIAQKTRLFFIPRGSIQERTLKSIYNFVRLAYIANFISILRSEGIRGLLQRIRNRINIKINKPTYTLGEGVTKVYDSMIKTAGNQPSDEYVPLAAKSFSASASPVKLIAFYLPQFHPIPENDMWWGKGFVEWTNVSKALPQFAGHYQPHLPGELGFYDLRIPDVQKRQIELARSYGIHGFAFHYYWFGGKRLLEKPLDLFLESKEDFPFCICWANENWTRRWDGQENEILIAQEHSPEIDLRFIQDISPILKDERYIRINGRPLLIIYRANIIPNIKQIVKLWREYCINNGIGDPYLIAAQTFGFMDPREIDFDAAVEFPPHDVALTNIHHRLQFSNPNYAGNVVDYKNIIEKIASLSKPEYKVFKTVFPGWDNEARKPGSGHTFAFSTPELYKQWLLLAAKATFQEPDPEKRLLFINAWNEWGEGAHLEPDRKYGYAYLQATVDALKEIAGKVSEKTDIGDGSKSQPRTVTFGKVICIHHRLIGLTSHQFNEAHGFMQEFDRRGKEFLLLISIHAKEEIAAKLHARAVLDDPTFRMEWSFKERSQRFLNMLHAQINADVNANDCVLITVSTQLEAHALTCWLQELPPGKKPWIVILILSDRWNRSGREEYERQVAEFRILKTAISNLPAEDKQRLIFCTLTSLLATELSDLLGTKVDVAPIPLEYGDPRLYSSAKSNTHLPRVAILGGTRREKGSYLIPDIVRTCQSYVQVEFLIHLVNNTLTDEEVKNLASIAEEPHVTIIREPMSLPEYNSALESADIVLFPYEVIPYRKRNSGVFAEAVAFGKPVVATGGTWMAEQIEVGRAAGTIFEDLQPDSIAKAIARCVADLKPLQQSAQTLSTEWRRKISLSAFVDYMEEQIALRSR